MLTAADQYSNYFQQPPPLDPLAIDDAVDAPDAADSEGVGSQVSKPPGARSRVVRGLTSAMGWFMGRDNHQGGEEGGSGSEGEASTGPEGVTQ